MTPTVFPLVQISQIPLRGFFCHLDHSFSEMHSIVLATLALSVVSGESELILDSRIVIEQHFLFVCSASAAAAGSFAASTINGLLALAHEPQSIYARQSLDPSTLPAAVSFQISLAHCLIVAHLHLCYTVQISLHFDLYHLECTS